MIIYFKHFYKFKNLIIVIMLLILNNCQLKEPDKVHGINFLKNRSNQLILNKTNKNDVVRIMGHPHTKSFSNENQWVYIERTLTKGEYHKLVKMF